ncbi:hypothetical protein SCEN_J02900 [Saccharomyces cerevisiae]|nr:hypothetical protein SCEN_J02900 [Saccharomyces cerevisiae]
MFFKVSRHVFFFFFLAWYVRRTTVYANLNLELPSNIHVYSLDLPYVIYMTKTFQLIEKNFLSSHAG